MSLITRCSACGTTFKVVTDQLKVSRGWVRCGHCAAVFDASLHLQDASAPPQAPDDSSPAGSSLTSEAQLTVPAGLAPHMPDLPRLPAVPTSGLLLKESGVETPIAYERVAATPSQDETRKFDPPRRQRHRQAAQTGASAPESGSQPSRALRRAGPEISAKRSSRRGAGGAGDEVSEWPEDEFDADEDVTFVRDAQRDSVGSRPVWRGVLGLLALLLTLLLGVQVMVQQRDAVAAMEPALRPLIESLCTTLHCEVGALRSIESVVIDSSSFTKTDIDSYRLSVSFKNAGSIPVAMPALEVTLTDLQDQPLARRVILPAQLGAKSSVLGPGADFASVVMMQVQNADLQAPAGPPGSAPAPGSGLPSGPARMSGYRVLAFYP
jgi:predicted Zn finger-like uncharacterized protein